MTTSIIRRRKATVFISSRQLARRWRVNPEEAAATMERHGMKQVPYGNTAWRWRMVDVEYVETGEAPPSMLRQLAREVRGLAPRH